MTVELFVCNYCNHVDSLHLAFEARRDLTGASVGGTQFIDTYQCTKCLTGRWHNRFPYRPYNPEEDLVCNRATGVGLE